MALLWACCVVCQLVPLSVRYSPVNCSGQAAPLLLAAQAATLHAKQPQTHHSKRHLSQQLHLRIQTCIVSMGALPSRESWPFPRLFGTDAPPATLAPPPIAGAKLAPLLSKSKLHDETLRIHSDLSNQVDQVVSALREAQLLSCRTQHMPTLSAETVRSGLASLPKLKQCFEATDQRFKVLRPADDCFPSADSMREHPQQLAMAQQCEVQLKEPAIRQCSVEVHAELGVAAPSPQCVEALSAYLQCNRLALELFEPHDRFERQMLRIKNRTKQLKTV